MSLPFAQVDVVLMDDPMFKDLWELELGCPETLAVGYVTRLWVWALGQCPDGHIVGYQTRHIERALGSNEPPGKLLNALVTCGFLSQTGEDSYEIPGFAERYGRLKAALRKREQRARDAQKKEQKTDGTRSQNVTRSDQTRLDQTRLDQTRLDQIKEEEEVPRPAPPSADPPPPVPRFPLQKGKHWSPTPKLLAQWEHAYAPHGVNVRLELVKCQQRHDAGGPKASPANWRKAIANWLNIAIERKQERAQAGPAPPRKTPRQLEQEKMQAQFDRLKAEAIARGEEIPEDLI